MKFGLVALTDTICEHAAPIGCSLAAGIWLCRVHFSTVINILIVRLFG